MKIRGFRGSTITLPIVAISLLVGTSSGPLWAQQGPSAAPEKVEEVVVTGSRIYQSEAQREQPLSIIDTAKMEATGLTDVGQLLQLHDQSLSL